MVMNVCGTEAIKFTMTAKPIRPISPMGLLDNVAE